MDKYAEQGLSRFLSLVLRHHPEILDLDMDRAGWVEVTDLLNKLNHDRDKKVTMKDIKYIVENNDKQRFALDTRDNIVYIRANQGHSIQDLEMGYESIQPPDVLYHGTGVKYVDSIDKEGLLHKSRQYVHLSATESVAKKVGQRHGKPCIYLVDAKRMYDDGIDFYCSENGVWLTEYVDPKYLTKKG